MLMLLKFSFLTIQVEEALQLWNDREFGGLATHQDLITALQKNRRAHMCKPLIEALKASSPGKLPIC